MEIGDDDAPLATPADAMREHGWNAGQERRNTAWILTPYDTWEKNPFYDGPPVPHPEDYHEETTMCNHDCCNDPRNLVVIRHPEGDKYYFCRKCGCDKL